MIGIWETKVNPPAKHDSGRFDPGSRNNVSTLLTRPLLNWRQFGSILKA